MHHISAYEPNKQEKVRVTHSPVFKKAFDSLSHKYIDEYLKMFNVGQSIQRWTSLFFCNREAYILLGGELAKKILLEQGVPQGNVVSSYIFILTA